MKGPRLSTRTRTSLALRVWRSYARVRWNYHRVPLPKLVGQLGKGSAGAVEITPERLGKAVQKALTVRHPPRCLIASLVLYDMLRGDDKRPELVIGLPASPTDKDAHAWIELDGVDVGPPPGRGTHQALARYGA
jgi:Transglutaminase-like superfamily